MEFDFPSVEPPEYLLRLNPHLFQQERQRITQRFDEAVRLAEEAFVGEFSKLVSHLVERLTNDETDGEWVSNGSAVQTHLIPIRQGGFNESDWISCSLVSAALLCQFLRPGLFAGRGTDSEGKGGET